MTIPAPPAHLKKAKKVEAEIVGDLFNGTMVQRAAELLQAKADKAMAQEMEKEANKKIATLEVELADMFEARGIDLARIPNLGTFSINRKNRPSISDGQQEEFIRWLDEQGEGSIAKRYVHPGTLASWVNERTENGIALPPFLNNFVQKTINVRKAKSNHGNETDE